VVKRLILAGTNVRRYGLVPFFGIAERRIDVEDHAAKRKDAMLDDLADLKFRGTTLVHGRNDIGPNAAFQ
jgi:hypothetical protein